MVQTFVFRVDSGTEIGSGHVMRCLTLADALTEDGGACYFITRAHQGHLNGAITARGHSVHQLPVATQGDFGVHPAAPNHASWLECNWQEDAQQTRAILENLQPDWLIVDHYALDKSWEEQVLPSGTALAVIDDLADRPHLARLLLDQNSGRAHKDYAGLVPNDCVLLIGPKFALLKPEFSQFRPQALARREGASPRHLLITLGGVDKDNATEVVLDAIVGLPLREDFEITVIMGPQAPWLESVRARAASMPCPTRVLKDVSNMAELMTKADFCIGAGGGTSWERCVLGLPTLLMVLAENQRDAATALATRGISIVLADHATPDFGASLLRAFTTLADPILYTRLSKACAALTLGDGTKTFRTLLAATEIELRAATFEDAKFIWQCRHDGDAWKYFKAPQPTPLNQHLIWLKSALKSDDHTIFIAQVDGIEFGFLRFDYSGSNVEVGLGLLGDYRGKKLGKRLIARAVLQACSQGLTALTAEVHKDNRSSHVSFLQTGFIGTKASGDFLTLTLELGTSSIP